MWRNKKANRNEFIRKLANNIKTSSQKIIIFQAGLIKLCNKEQGNTNSDLERRIETLEEKEIQKMIKEMESYENNKSNS